MITNCTGRKIKDKGEIPARDRYIGPSFVAAKAECEREWYDLAMVSAEFGYIYPETKVPDYDTVFKGSVLSRDEKKHDKVVNPTDENVRQKIVAALKKDLAKYDEIIVFLPEHYTRAIEPVLNEFTDKIKLRRYMKRHLNKPFLDNVIAGEAKITPKKKYEDVQGNPVKCDKCEKLLDGEIIFHRGRIFHQDCINH
ncbi:MAG: hypothetical protein O8C64_03225 [Candidatus Methanoperedens sp.]|nr:hypothetical protein [Candidatus Methanoperedens sp.]MCZ7405752.1 hypothetical protein [Candidatus Methanoperedens sp.]